MPRPSARSARRCACPPAAGSTSSQARELLAAINGLGLTCVVVSNAAWRDTQAYQHDFADLGVADRIDAVISSVDAGYRKPHRMIFHNALFAARCGPPAAVMIGNSEAKDIEPALALGMQTIRVAIEEPLPARSAAHAVASSLDKVAATLRAWVRASRDGTLFVHAWERR
jgi:FMN phosphatase YigB (HAD superfamily)